MIIKHAFDGLCVCLVVPPSQILFKSPSARQDIWKREGSGGSQWANCISCKITSYHSARADTHGWRELSGDAASASHGFLLGPQPGQPSPFGLWPRGHLQPPAPVPGFREALAASQQEGRTSRHYREAAQGSRREEFNCSVLLADGLWKWQHRICHLRGQTDPTVEMTYKVLSSGGICCSRFEK